MRDDNTVHYVGIVSSGREVREIGKTALVVVSHVHSTVKHDVFPTHRHHNTAAPNILASTERYHSNRLCVAVLHPMSETARVIQIPLEAVGKACGHTQKSKGFENVNSFKSEVEVEVEVEHSDALDTLVQEAVLAIRDDVAALLLPGKGAEEYAFAVCFLDSGKVQTVKTPYAPCSCAFVGSHLFVGFHDGYVGCYQVNFKNFQNLKWEKVKFDENPLSKTDKFDNLDNPENVPRDDLPTLDLLWLQRVHAVQEGGGLVGAPVTVHGNGPFGKNVLVAEIHAQDTVVVVQDPGSANLFARAWKRRMTLQSHARVYWIPKVLSRTHISMMFDFGVDGFDTSGTENDTVSEGTEKTEKTEKMEKTGELLVLGSPVVSFYDAKALDNTLVTAAKSIYKFASRWWNDYEPETTPEAKFALEEASKPAKRTVYFEDAQRTFNGHCSVDAQGEWLAFGDTLGRVIVMSMYDRIWTKMFKGYRNASCAWLPRQILPSGKRKTGLRLLIFAPRRNVLDTWSWLETGWEKVSEVKVQGGQLVQGEAGVVYFVHRNGEAEGFH